MHSDFTGHIRPDYVPATDYAGVHVPALEKARLWPRIWHIACREEEIPNVGDFYNYEIYDESILVVRTKKEEIKAYYNVCQHRGRRLRDEERGNVAQGFFCRFHGWRYALDGSITYIYDQDDWKTCPDFKRDNLNLKEPAIGRWAGWIWINMDPGAQPLLEYLAPIAARLKNFEMEKMRLAWYETIIAPVNWKVVVEAFNEGYHSGATHTHAIDYKQMDSPGHVHGPHTMYYTKFMKLPSAKVESGRWSEVRTLQELLYYQSLEIYETLFALVMEPLMHAITRVKNETQPDAPPEEVFGKLWDWHKEELEKAGLRWPEKLTPEELADAGTGWHMFPNTVMLPAVDGVLWYRMRPYGDDPDQCIFDIWCLRPYKSGNEPKVERHITHGFEAFRGRNPFLEQDFDNMVAVNKGMKSQGWLGAVCSPHQEIQISNFHKTLREYLLGKPQSLERKKSVRRTAVKKKSRARARARTA
jgi:phenylpropionate dioxygenase-like ring-hydroxylating dioxygenase large terminal subunit